MAEREVGKFRPGWQPFFDRLLELPFHSVVDFGCGYGFQVRDFAKAGKSAEGVDRIIHPFARAEAEQNGYILWEKSWDELAPASYGAGWSHHCLEHCRDPVGTLHTWGQIIQPGGLLCVMVPIHRTDALAGHIATGWNISQLMYLLAVAGWDCRDGEFLVADETIGGIVRRPEQMIMADPWQGLGPILPLLPFTCDPATTRGFEYKTTNVNWRGNKSGTTR